MKTNLYVLVEEKGTGNQKSTFFNSKEDALEALYAANVRMKKTEHCLGNFFIVRGM